MSIIRNISFMVASFSLLFAFVAPAAPAYAAPCDNGRFLTFPTWYRGLTDGDCNIKAPSSGEGGIATFIWAIVLNVLEIALQLVMYVSAGYIIWGGFLYMAAASNADNIVRARKMIQNAVFGLVISLFAVVGVSFIVGAIT